MIRRKRITGGYGTQTMIKAVSARDIAKVRELHTHPEKFTPSKRKYQTEEQSRKCLAVTAVDTNRDNVFVRAAFNDDIDMINYLAIIHPNVTEALNPRLGAMPILIANAEKTIRRLIELGADIDHYDENHPPLLHQCIKQHMMPWNSDKYKTKLLTFIKCGVNPFISYNDKMPIDYYLYMMGKKEQEPDIEIINALHKAMVCYYDRQMVHKMFAEHTYFSQLPGDIIIFIARFTPKRYPLK